MIPVLVAVGLAWILLRKSDDDSTSDDEVPTYDPDFENPDIPDEVPNTKEAVYTSSNGERVVWKIGVPVYQKIYENYETSQAYTWDVTFEYHWQVGNVEGTSFLEQSDAQSYEGRKITKFYSKQSAIDEILRAEERDAEPDDPTGGPVSEPEEQEPEPERPPSPPPADFGGMNRYTDLSSSMGV